MNALRKAILKWKAKRLLSSLGISMPPVDATYVANALGYEVVDATLKGEDMSHVLGFCDIGERTIYVTRCKSFADKQMTVAVEIAKTLLHPQWCIDGSRYKLRTSRGPAEREEVEAEWFALNLLVPGGWVARIKPYATMEELERIFIADRTQIFGSLAGRPPVWRSRDH